jgi:hypothetical protein
VLGIDSQVFFDLEECKLLIDLRLAICVGDFSINQVYTAICSDYTP